MTTDKFTDWFDSVEMGDPPIPVPAPWETEMYKGYVARKVTAKAAYDAGVASVLAMPGPSNVLTLAQQANGGWGMDHE